MIILGIDPGSRITGFGLIKKTGNHIQHIENGSIYLNVKDSFASRLMSLHQEMQSIISAFSPQALAIENIFYHKNPKSIQKLGEVRGVALLSGAIASLEIAEYTPLEIKKAVTGYGNASKEQMQQMTRVLLNLKDIAEENASDALGIALCHAHSTNTITKLIKTTKPKLKGTKEILKKASYFR